MFDFVQALGSAPMSEPELTVARPMQPPVRSIAVLPFANLSGDPENEYFGDGLAEELLSLLGSVKGLRVASRTSAFVFKNSKTDLRTIGQTLNVQNVLEGSVRKAGNRIRVTAQLSNATDGYDIWSERYDRELKDVFAIQDEIAHTIVDALHIQITGEQAERLGKRTTVDPEAYDCYLKGRHHWNNRPTGTSKAVEYFKQAVARIPATPWRTPASPIATGAWAAGKATRCRPAMPGRSLRRRLDALWSSTIHWARHTPRWLTCTCTTIGIGPPPKGNSARQWNSTRPTPRHTTGSPISRWPWDVRRHHSPKAGDVWSWIQLISSSTSISSGTTGSRASLTKPSSRDRRLASCIPIRSGRSSSSDWHTRTSRCPTPQSPIWRRPQRCRADSFVLAALGHAHAAAGQRGKALELLETLNGLSRERYVPAYDRAMIYLGLNQIDPAIEWLQRAYQERSSWISYLNVEPRLAPLRSDPRFIELTKGLGYPEPASNFSSPQPPISEPRALLDRACNLVPSH